MSLPLPPPCSDTERMAVLLAREVRDGEISACGAHSMIPAAGLLLARELHAPGVDLIILGTPITPFATSRQFHYLAMRGDLGLFFVSGVQIDRWGNYNLHQVGGTLEQPHLRLPGGYGGGMIYYAARRTVVFRTEHSPRALVERVDYISGAGDTPPEVLRLGWPSKVITPLATLRFHKPEATQPGQLVLESVHGSQSPQAVQSQTGFDLGPLNAVPRTQEPTDAELGALRGVVRERMIAEGIYADWARSQLNPVRGES